MLDRESTAQAVAQALETRLGVSHVRVLSPDMLNLLGRGVLAEVQVRLPTGGFKVSLPREELGVQPTRVADRRDEQVKALNEHLRAAQQADLLPRDLMKHLGSWTDAQGNEHRGIRDPDQARRAIYLLFPSTRKTADDPNARLLTEAPLLGAPTRKPENVASRHELLAIPTYQGAFITESAWDKWYPKFERAREAYYHIRDQLLEHYDMLKAASQANYRIIAGRMYDIILAATGEPPERPGGAPYTLQGWLDHWRQRIWLAWPTREQIRTGFAVEPDFAYPPRPTEVARELAQAEDIRLQTMRERIEVETAQSIAREVRQTEVRRAHELIDQFLATFAQRVEDACLPFLAATAKHHRVSGKQLEALHGLIEMVNTLGEGVDGLAGLRAQMDRVQTLLQARDQLEVTDTVRAYRLDLDDNTKALATALRETARVVREETQALGAMDARETNPARYGDPDALLAEILGHTPVMAVARHETVDLPPVDTYDELLAQVQPGQLLTLPLLPGETRDEVLTQLQQAAEGRGLRVRSAKSSAKRIRAVVEALPPTTLDPTLTSSRL